ncbi:AMP-binding protein, partial [Streptomyces lydicus]
MADPGREPLDALVRFRQAVRAHPDRIAVRAGEEALTFAELDRRTGALAGELASLGVARGDRIGVALGRGTR